MTNIEALRAQSAILANIPDSVLEFQLEDYSLEKDQEYVRENRRAIDLAFAGLILFISTQTTSLRELDWAVTNVSMADLLKLRASILKKWGVRDETVATIRGVRVW